MKVLIVIDMQNDFTTGVLGNEQTAVVVERVADEIKNFRENEKDGRIIATLDTHFADYLKTQEGKNLPVPHCIRYTEGWSLDPLVKEALGDDFKVVEKLTFGAIDLPIVVGWEETIEEIRIIGVCTDICVISNAMIVKSAFPEIPVKVIADCCAGTTPESHENALNAMKACQIIIE